MSSMRMLCRGCFRKRKDWTYVLKAPSCNPYWKVFSATSLFINHTFVTILVFHNIICKVLILHTVASPASKLGGAGKDAAAVGGWFSASKIFMPQYCCIHVPIFRISFFYNLKLFKNFDLYGNMDKNVAGENVRKCFKNYLVAKYNWNATKNTEIFYK